jgi:UDP-N-acetyl-D-mannosaminuronic acid dehydrogenase
MKNISIIGLGYIGLPTAALLANSGYNVFGFDLNKQAVDLINQGKIHIVEPELDDIVRKVVNVGKLKAYNKPHEGDVYIICVPTPFHENNGNPIPNIDYVIAATKSISNLIKKGDIIILESTSPVGTTEKIKNTLLEDGINIEDIYIAYCPERVVPGKILHELIFNDRVIGGVTIESAKIIADFYRTFVKGEVIETDDKTAEMCKLTENSFRDVNIAFANELSMICEKEGIDVWNLIKLANRHPRVNILQPGCGVGGHCIAVDPWFIVSRDPENAKLIKVGREVNNSKTKWVINKIKCEVEKFNQEKKSAKITCLGLSFKPDIDDLRESPAIEIYKALVKEGFEVNAVEPNISAHDTIKLVSLENSLKNSDILVLLVKHKEFLNLKNEINNIVLLDFCGL